MASYRKRYGTPLPPGRRRRRILVPRNGAELRSAARRPRNLVRAAGSFVGAIALVGVAVFVTSPAPPPTFDRPVDSYVAMGAFRTRSLADWKVTPGGIDLARPWTLYAPQNDPAARPTTVTFSGVDATAIYTGMAETIEKGGQIDAADVATLPNAERILAALVRRWAAEIGRGSYCTNPTSYTASADGGIGGPAIEVVWLAPAAAASPIAGLSTDRGQCPANVLDGTSFVRSDTPASSPSVASRLEWVVASAGVSIHLPAGDWTDPTDATIKLPAAPGAKQVDARMTSLGDATVTVALVPSGEPARLADLIAGVGGVSSKATKSASGTAWLAEYVRDAVRTTMLLVPAADHNALVVVSVPESDDVAVRWTTDLVASAAAMTVGEGDVLQPFAAGDTSPPESSDDPARDPPVAAQMVYQRQWFALPAWYGFAEKNTARMLVVTLTVPTDADAARLAEAVRAFAILTGPDLAGL